MIIRGVNLETICGMTNKLPENTLPEFAFAGKSSVGKSSFINALMNRKTYTRASLQPGKTQTINLHNINGALYYVDLPGYGYIKMAIEIREKQGEVIEQYLKNFQMLRMILLLVNIRHEPSASNKLMYEWVTFNGYHLVIIVAELSKTNRSQVQKHVKMVRGGPGMKKDGIITPFSAEVKQGGDDVWDLIEGSLQTVPISAKRKLI